MKLLMHSCCGPCSIYPLEVLKAEGYEVTACYLNPNIHPFKEFEARLNSLEKVLQDNDVELLATSPYGLEMFIHGLDGQFTNRCGYCYKLRLNETARLAANAGFEVFSTSLLVSPYQNQEKIIAAGLEAGKMYGVDFLVKDFRSGYRQAMEKARQMGLYMQKYCGCIFSEEERYLKINK